MKSLRTAALVSGGALLLVLFVGFVSVRMFLRKVEAGREAAWKPSAEAVELEKLISDDELQVLADRVLATPYSESELRQPMLRHGALAPVREYVERLAMRRRGREIVEYLSAVKEIHGVDVRTSLLAIEIASHGARGRASRVEKNFQEIADRTEDGACLRRVREFLTGDPDLEDWSGVFDRAGDQPLIVLLAGDLEDRPFVEFTAQRMREEFEVEVLCFDSELTWGRPDRGHGGDLLETCRSILAGASSKRRRHLLAAVREKTWTESKMRLLVAAARQELVTQERQDEVRALDDALRSFRMDWRQWDGESRQAELRGKYAPRVGAKTVVIEITRRGLFEEGLRYCLSYGLPGFGIVSYDLMRESYDVRGGHDRELLKRRIYQQAVNMIGHGLEVPRCQDPRCVRIGVGGVDDVDDGHPSVCPECAQGIRRAWGK